MLVAIDPRMKTTPLLRPASVALLAVAALTLPVLHGSGPAARPARRAAAPARPAHPIHGSVERYDAAMDALVAPGVQMERLATGFNWSEGPTWLHRERAVVFSDVPENVIHRWSERDGLTQYLRPSGYTGQALEFNEQGSNGLTTDAAGRLVICQHGDRRISRWEPGRGFTPLVSLVDGRRFNSPNDLVFDRGGNLYFTDPPYGLKGGNESASKELVANGVYLLRRNGRAQLLSSAMTFPNGIALSPDERTLYVNQSDPKAPIIKSFPVLPDGTVGEGRVFFDTTRLMERGLKGLPDGLKVDERGNLWATGPGGVLVISPEGRLLGLLNTGEATGNCCWGDDGSTLYITADMHLLRIRTQTKGYGFRR